MCLLSSDTQASAQLHELLDDVSQSHEPVLIGGEHGNVVLVSDDDWRAEQETLHLLSVPVMRESIREGIAAPREELADHLDW